MENYRLSIQGKNKQGKKSWLANQCPGYEELRCVGHKLIG
jgi:hypothetical protein